MKRPTKIFLIGPMGAGKSTIGKQLASSMGLEFIDSDNAIRERTGVDIATIFEYEGEQGFRKREAKIIDELTQQENIVLATGGGAVTTAEVANNLASRGFVIYLHCSPEQQYERTIHDKSRPLIQTDDPKATLEGLMEVREPLYREFADLVVTTEKRSAASVVKEVVQYFDEN
ncbi:MAG: shikimate kinase AroK [Gammaproteobacteria bacterium]|nr:shikimate kinase AroK [Gammaproteobacteria bacterium]NNJ91530.1 shikimate kinase AroK [Gammaproteobacteria bacterium]